MTNFETRLLELVPDNLLKDDNIQKVLDVFFKVIDKTIDVSSNMTDFININTEELSDDIVRTYLQNIHDVLQNIDGDIGDIGIGAVPEDARVPYCYEGEGVEETPVLTVLDNKSSGLDGVPIGSNILVQYFTINDIVETDKVFKKISNIDMSITVQEAFDTNLLKPVIKCCSGQISCDDNGQMLCEDIDIPNYLKAGGSIETLLQNLESCKNFRGGTKSPYPYGSPYLYTDFYIDKDFIKESFDIKNLLKNITEEHIWSSKDYKQNKGHQKAFLFPYNIIKDNGFNDSFNDVSYLEIEEGDEPFKYTIKTLLHKFLYNSVVHPISHPVGFNGEFKRLLGFEFVDNFCKGVKPIYDAVFLYDIETELYSDVRNGSGMFGNNGLLANKYRYDVEIKDIYAFEQHGRSYKVVTLTNDYSFIKNFDDSIVLVNQLGEIIKTYKDTTGLVFINSEMFDKQDNKLYSTSNELTNFSKVYRIDFNNDGKLEGGFMSNEHAIIYLENGLSYHIANNRIALMSVFNEEIVNYGKNREMLYNGLKTEEVALCKDKMNTTIGQRMATCLPHWTIYQAEDLGGDYIDHTIPNPTTTIQEVLETYNGDELAKHLLENTDIFNTNQGIDVNGNGVDIFTEYGKVFDFGFSYGGKDFVGTDYNKIIKDNSGIDVRGLYAYGSFNACGENLSIYDAMVTKFKYGYFDALNVNDISAFTISNTIRDMIHLDNDAKMTLTQKYNTFGNIIYDGDTIPTGSRFIENKVDVNEFINNLSGNISEQILAAFDDTNTATGEPVSTILYGESSVGNIEDIIVAYNNSGVDDTLSAYILNILATLPQSTNGYTVGQEKSGDTIDLSEDFNIE